MSTLSLFQIEAQLIGLVDALEDAETRQRTCAPNAPELPDVLMEVEVIQKEIRKYIAQEVRKVDGIAAYVRECVARQLVARSEAKRFTERAAVYAAREERLRSIVIEVMQGIGERRLDGSTATLTIKKNPPGVDIPQPELIPDSCRKFSIEGLTVEQYKYLRYAMKNIAPDLFLGVTETVKSEPSKTAIRKLLDIGKGVPGARLRKDSVRLEVA